MKNDFFHRIGFQVSCLSVMSLVGILVGCQSGSNEQGKTPPSEETVGVVDATSNKDSEKQAAPEHKSILEIASDDLKPYLVLIPGLEADDEIPITAKRTFRSDEQIKLDNMELIKFEPQPDGALRISETVVQFVGFSATVKLKNKELSGEFEIAGLRFVFFKGSLVRYVQYTRVDANIAEGDVRIGDYTVDHIVSSAASQVVGAADAAIATFNLAASSEDVDIDELSGSGGGQSGSAPTSEPVTISVGKVAKFDVTDFPELVPPPPMNCQTETPITDLSGVMLPPGARIENGLVLDSNGQPVSGWFSPYGPDLQMACIKNGRAYLVQGQLTPPPGIGIPGPGQGPGSGQGGGQGGGQQYSPSAGSGGVGGFSGGNFTGSSSAPPAVSTFAACTPTSSSPTNLGYWEYYEQDHLVIVGSGAAARLYRFDQPVNGLVTCKCGTILCCVAGQCYVQ